MASKFQYPVNFTMGKDYAGFRDSTNRPTFTVKSHSPELTKYAASCICHALNSHYTLAHDLRDALEIVESVKTTLGVDPKQEQRLREIYEHLEHLFPKAHRHANKN